MQNKPNDQQVKREKHTNRLRETSINCHSVIANQLTETKIMKCKQTIIISRQFYIILVALFILILTLSSTFQTNNSTTSLVGADEISTECLDKCGEDCDPYAKRSRITCFSRCLANKCLT